MRFLSVILLRYLQSRENVITAETILTQNYSGMYERDAFHLSLAYGRD